MNWSAFSIIKCTSNGKRVAFLKEATTGGPMPIADTHYSIYKNALGCDACARKMYRWRLIAGLGKSNPNRAAGFQLTSNFTRSRLFAAGSLGGCYPVLPAGTRACSTKHTRLEKRPLLRDRWSLPDDSNIRQLK